MNTSDTRSVSLPSHVCQSHRSCDAGMYSALPYAVAQGTVETPYIFVQAVFFSVITYFLFHLQVDAGETCGAISQLRLCKTRIHGLMQGRGQS